MKTYTPMAFVSILVLICTITGNRIVPILITRFTMKLYQLPHCFLRKMLKSSEHL